MIEVKLVEDHSTEVINEMHNRVLAALTAAGLQCEGNGKLELENDPRRIDTGNLRNSITNQVESGEQAVYIGTNVEYALYVHEGTSKMIPNRFMKNALYNHANEYRDIIKSFLGQ